MTPTTQEELQAFFAQVMPGFLEYLRSHQSAIEQVELATVKTGIVSFPATQILGGVQKTVRVPLSLVTADVDEQAQYAQDMGDYAKAQGDYAKTQGNYAKAQGDYADEKGSYAQTQGAAALAAKNTVEAWYTPFKTTAESFYNDTMLGVWQPWYTTFKNTAEGWYSPFKTSVEGWYADRVADWASFYTNGAVPQWATMTAAYQSDHNRAESDHSTATSDHTQAGTDHTASVTATNEASNVNATLVGMTVTITDRHGVSNSVKIGFEIAPENVYNSKNDMIADAANVLPGKFCMIATTDPTATDNATLWSRNSQPASAGADAFTFLSDLDQASSSAWADWLDNQKPLIIAATTAANTAAATATQQGNVAEAQGNTAEGKGNYAKAQGDRAKAYSDNPWEIRQDGFIWVWDETTETMVRTNKMIIAFDDLTPQQIQSMIDIFFQTLVFDDVPTQGSNNVVKSGGIYDALATKQPIFDWASIQTCRDIISELL